VGYHKIMFESQISICRKILVLSVTLVLVVIAAQRTGAAEGSKKLRLAYAGWEIGTAVAYI
jgi:hypothetical protein